MGKASDWETDASVDSVASRRTEMPTGEYSSPRDQLTVDHSVNTDDTQVFEPGLPVGERKLHGLLVQLNGPRRYEIFPIKAYRTTIGRNRQGDVTVVVDDPTVSNPHCKISAIRDTKTGTGDVMGFAVRDMESENGTWVNGRMVDEKELSDRDIIRIGRTDLLFIRIPERPGEMEL